MCADRKWITRLNSRANARSAKNVIKAIAQVLKGRAVSTGSIFMIARMEFCHSAARHRYIMTTRRQTTATNALAMDRIRDEGSGSSRYRHSQRQRMPAE